MELPIIIEPLPDHKGFVAHLAAPLNLSAQAATADEAHRELVAQLRRRLEEGAELRTLNIPALGASAGGGWLPQDELTEEWLQHVQEYRAECDAADRAELGETPEQRENLP
jgi:hypothetical protein